MTTKELMALPRGEYDLTDQIDNYHYRMRVGLDGNGNRYYSINVTDYQDYSKIFIHQTTNRDGIENLYIGGGVGGLRVYSDDVHGVISELKLI